MASNDDLSNNDTPDVLRLQQVNISCISDLLSRYNLQLRIIAPDLPIPGSFWGDEEAGLIKNQVFARLDTPIHSLLHESCHYICMDSRRRNNLHTNAGGTSDEENAVCYLQVLLADELPFMGKKRMMSDMNRWGYNFRLGTCEAWFEHDTTDEKHWLLSNNLITSDFLKPSFKLRH